MSELKKCPYCEQEFETTLEIKQHCYENCEELLFKNCDARIIHEDIMRENPWERPEKKEKELDNEG